jgi:hypothetical protein
MIRPKSMGYKLTDADINNIEAKRLKCELAIVDSGTTAKQFATHCAKERVEVSPKIVKLLFEELDEELHNANALMERFNKFLKAKKK